MNRRNFIKNIIAGLALPSVFRPAISWCNTGGIAMRAQYNPRFREVEVKWQKMFEAHKDDFQIFYTGYHVKELYDSNGDMFQQLTPFTYIKR